MLFTFRAVKRRHCNRKYASFTLNAPGRIQGGRKRWLFSVYSTDSSIEEFVLLRRFLAALESNERLTLTRWSQRGAEELFFGRFFFVRVEAI